MKFVIAYVIIGISTRYVNTCSSGDFKSSSIVHDATDGLQCYQCPKWTGVSDCYQNGDEYGELTTCPAGVTTCYNNWSKQGDTKIFYRGCMNAYPGYKAGECWEQDDPGIGSGKSKICFCGEDECNGFDMAEDELDK